MQSEEYKRTKVKYQTILNTVNEISKSELAPFWNQKKFLDSTLFHQIAVFAAMLYKNHSDSTYIVQLLDFTKFKSTDYLKAIRWFEYRAGKSLIIIDGKLKKNPVNTLKDENYQTFGDFMRQYNGPLPEVKFTNKENENKEITLDCTKKESKSGRDPHDEYDLIDGTSMRIGGQRVIGGYGTGKRK